MTNAGFKPFHDKEIEKKSYHASEQTMKTILRIIQAVVMWEPEVIE